MPQGKVREGFRYDFGAGANNLTVDVPAGARCVWHEENGCWYVDENDVPAYAKHDAIYRGIKVHPDNVEPWRKIPTDARFEAGTKTIRSVPENYWLASIDSWDGAIDHDATAEIFAAAFQMRAAMQEFVQRVEAGEIRSKRTYAKFKAILGRMPA